MCIVPRTYTAINYRQDFENIIIISIASISLSPNVDWIYNLTRELWIFFFNIIIIIHSTTWYFRQSMRSCIRNRRILLFKLSYVISTNVLFLQFTTKSTNLFVRRKVNDQFVTYFLGLNFFLSRIFY